jgi:AraC family L-rhamnose operon regulatory protein RhaS
MPLAKRHTPIDVHLPSYGVYLFESHHAPGFRMTPEAHEFLELFFVLGGSGRFWIDGRSHPCGPSCLVVVPPGARHTIEDHPSNPLALYAVCVDRQVIRHEPDLFQQLPVGTVRGGSSLADQSRAIFRQLLFEQTHPQPFGPLVITGLCQQLLAALGRFRASAGSNALDAEEQATVHVRLAAVERYVAELSSRFFERTSLDAAALSLGMSRRRFTTLFWQFTGQTWGEYLARLRIDYACKLLGETSRSIVAIAFECGYEDLSSFYRAFKRQTGHSPGDWRVRQSGSIRSARRPSKDPASGIARSANKIAQNAKPRGGGIV